MRCGSIPGSLQQLRSLDGETLELFLDHYVSNADEARIREQLVARFKTSRLRAPDHKVVRRVLKRGHLADLEEYYQVKEYVSCVDHIDDIGEESYAMLDNLLEHYDGPDQEMAEPTPLPANPGATQPSRRRPPPPFDHILVDDEKLCPPDAPFETRLAFVEAKFALVIQRAISAHVRDALQFQLKSNRESVFSPQVPPSTAMPGWNGASTRPSFWWLRNQRRRTSRDRS